MAVGNGTAPPTRNSAPHSKSAAISSGGPGELEDEETQDQGLAELVGNVPEALNFEIFVSLSCHNCPLRPCNRAT